MRVTVLFGLMPLLGVEDLERSIRFYARYLGFRVERQGPAGDRMPAFAHLRNGGVDLMLYRLQPGSVAMQDRAARKKMRLQIAVGDLPGWREHLRARGLASLAVPGTASSFEVEDPDGYLVRFGASMAAEVVFAPTGPGAAW